MFLVLLSFYQSSTLLGEAGAESKPTMSDPVLIGLWSFGRFPGVQAGVGLKSGSQANGKRYQSARLVCKRLQASAGYET